MFVVKVVRYGHCKFERKCACDPRVTRITHNLQFMGNLLLDCPLFALIRIFEIGKFFGNFVCSSPYFIFSFLYIGSLLNGS